MSYRGEYDPASGDYISDPRLEAFIAAGQVRKPCPWCEVELRPCNLTRHIAARHFRQLTIYDVLDRPPRRPRTATR